MGASPVPALQKGGKWELQRAVVTEFPPRESPALSAAECEGAGSNSESPARSMKLHSLSRTLSMSPQTPPSPYSTLQAAPSNKSFLSKSCLAQVHKQKAGLKVNL